MKPVPKYTLSMISKENTYGIYSHKAVTSTIMVAENGVDDRFNKLPG